jgi:hypothetical protein
MIALTVVIVLLIVALILQYYYKTPQAPEEIVVPYPVYVEPRLRRDPEFRGPPYKQYKPKNFQQMGLLLGDSGDILPLYGRESRGYRDRYQYYSGSPGDQIYSLPLTHKDRECTEDIGCNEFYGGEKVTVTGKTGDYTVKMYETEQLYY